VRGRRRRVPTSPPAVRDRRARLVDRDPDARRRRAKGPGMNRVSDEVLADLHRRLDATRWPDDGPAGFALSDARELAAYWRDGYDWRAAEDEPHGFSHVDVDGAHAIVEGDGPPLLLMHGWPSTVWEFHRVIPRLREHFRLVVPSLPGYGWTAGRGGTGGMGAA